MVFLDQFYNDFNFYVLQLYNAKMLADWLTPNLPVKSKRGKISHSISSASAKQEELNFSTKKAKLNLDNKKEKTIINEARSNKSKTIKIISGTQKQISQIQNSPQQHSQQPVDQEDKMTIGNNQKNKIRTKIKELQLERQEIMREGMVVQRYTPDFLQVKNKQNKLNSSSINKIKRPEVKVQSNRTVQNSLLIRMQQKMYEQIANEIELNSLHSKVRILDHQPIQKRQENLFQKLRSSESQLVGSPELKNRLAIDQENKQSNQKVQLSKDMQKIEEDDYSARSFEENYEEIPYINNKKGDQDQKIPQKVYTSKNGRMKIQAKKAQQLTIKQNDEVSYNKDEKMPIDLNISSGLINHKIQQRRERANHDLKAQKEKYDNDINILKKVVKDLRMQKIKAIAEIKHNEQQRFTQSSNKQRASAPKRYQTVDLDHNEPSNDRQSNTVVFGKIKRNRISFTHKAQNSTNLKLKPERPDQDPGNIAINQQNSQETEFLSLTNREYQVKNKTICFSARDQPKNYEIINLSKLKNQSLEHDFTSFKQKKDIHIKTQLLQEKVRSNKISMRGQDLCSKFLDQFDKNDKKFRKFLKNETIKNYLVKSSFSFEQEPNKLDSTQQKFENTLGTTIKSSNKSFTKDNTKRINLNSSILGHQIKLKIASFILEYDETVLKPRPKTFRLKSIPEIPESPNFTSTTEQLMVLLEKILPLFSTVQQEKDLQGCILKKYKNCLTFSLAKDSNFRIIWHFTGKLYIGEWDMTNNVKNGRGVEYHANKYYFEGKFQDNKKCGQGIMMDLDGSVYEGSYLNNLRHGFGKYYNKDYNSYYQGEWSKGLKQGKGHFEQSGNIYQGQFQSDLREGLGIQLFKNGDQYIGEYKLDKLNGEGKYIWYNRSFYIGLFHDGYRQGQGIWQSSLQNYELYIGQFQGDKRHGKGKYIWANSVVYQGQFFQDAKHGLGSMQCPDGRFIEGIWTQDVLSEVLSKITESNKEDPLQFPSKGKRMEQRTTIRIISMNE